VRFGHVNTGAKNKPAPKETTGFECDKLSASGAEQHFAGYIGRLTKPNGPAGGGRMQGMLIDRKDRQPRWKLKEVHSVRYSPKPPTKPLYPPNQLTINSKIT